MKAFPITIRVNDGAEVTLHADGSIGGALVATEIAMESVEGPSDGLAAVSLALAWLVVQLAKAREQLAAARKEVTRATDPRNWSGDGR